MSNGWLTIFTSLGFAGLMPFFVQRREELRLVAAAPDTDLLAVASSRSCRSRSSSRSARSSRNARTPGQSRRDRLPFSRVAIRFGSQSRPNSACLPTTTVSGVMLGPPILIFTSSPAFL